MYLGGTVLRGGGGRGELIEGGQENHKGRVDSCGDQRMGRKASFLSIVVLGLGFGKIWSGSFILGDLLPSNVMAEKMQRL